MDSDAPETVPPPYRSNTESILEQWHQQLWLAVPGSILKENNFFYFLLCGSTHTVAKEVLGVFFD